MGNIKVYLFSLQTLSLFVIPLINRQLKQKNINIKKPRKDKGGIELYYKYSGNFNFGMFFVLIGNT